MIRPGKSLLTKILFWFFLNMALVGGILAVVVAFQPRMQLHTLFGLQGSDRLRSAAMLIAHDLQRDERLNWSSVLARHARVQGIDFALVMENGQSYASRDLAIQEKILAKARETLFRAPPLPRPGAAGRPDGPPGERGRGGVPRGPAAEVFERFAEEEFVKPQILVQTRDPKLYWTGIPIPVDFNRPPGVAPGLLFAVSGSLSGNGFFFDPFPWMLAAVAVVLFSSLLWVPMVRSITRPLARMTRATEAVAEGRFDVVLHEPGEDEIGRLARAVNHMTARLAAFVQGQKRFLGDVAHELGSPIARIQFGLGALEQRIEGNNRERVADVLEDVAHMSQLVGELLAFSRAEMKGRELALERVELLPLVEEAVRRESGAEDMVEIRIAPDLRVMVNPELLKRGVANLVRNSLKYAAGQGPVTVSAYESEGRVLLAVEDFGPGVAEEYLDQLFEPFFRPEPSRDRGSGGVGLGLAIVKTCVETCGGTVSARNLQQGGFAVTMRLPAC